MRLILFICTILSYTALCGAPTKTISLENDRIAATFDARSGALIRLENKCTGWLIMDRAVLGQSFELLLPLEGKEMTEQDLRFNVVSGLAQQAPVIEQTPGKISFTWHGMWTRHMSQTADITFRGDVRLTDTGLEYGGELMNNSSYPVEYVSWPCIGEVSVPDKNQPLHHSTRNDIRELFPRFYNQHGYWGVDYPTSTYELPERSFVLVNNNEQGFVVFNRAAAPRYMVITSFELTPGYEIRGVNPYQDEIDGELVRIGFKANQVVYNKPGEASTLDAVCLAPYKGTWCAGLDIYKQVRGTAAAEKGPAWLHEPLTWQKIGVGSGEELLRYAKQSTELGVDVLQVRGWYRDRNGGVVEVPGMAEAIATCQEMGLRVVLETNWTQVDMRTQAYTDKLKKYIMKDPFGMPYNRTFLCPLAEEVQQMAMREWLELPALRAADGYINTDHNHCDKSFFCFDASHGHRPGEPTVNGTMALDCAMAATVKSWGDKAALGFGFLNEQSTYYDGYQITASDGQFAKHRYLAPALPIVGTIDVRQARRDMNQALMNRFNISYDLRFYSNNLKDYPRITEYGRQIENLRTKYAAALWNAAFAEPLSARVEGRDLAYSVFVGKDGKRAVVVVNTDTEQATAAKVTVDGAVRLTVVSPEAPELKPCNGSVEIAPLSAVVIIEQ